MKIKFSRDYSIAVNGYEVHNFKAGDEWETENIGAIATIKADKAMEVEEFAKVETKKVKKGK